MYLNVTKHFSLKLFIKLKVLVIVNGLSPIILNYLSFTVKKQTNKLNTPDFILILIIL